MTPAARCQSALEILGQIDACEAAADAVLGMWFRGHRFAGSRDRAAIQALVYAVLRRRAQLDWWCARAGVKVTGRTRVLAALALAGPWPGDEAAAAFAPARYGAEPLDEEESRFSAVLAAGSLDHADQPAAVRLNIPDWLERPLLDAFGERLEVEMKALLPEATVDLRANTLKVGREALLDRLAEEGIEAVATPWSPVGVRLARRRPLAGLAAAREGLFEPQDEGSQIVTLMTGVRPGQAVLDLCAGGGGKALGLAAMMANRGRLVLADIDEKRLTRARPRLDRAGIEIAELAVMDVADRNDTILNNQYFDVVLVDAPCSGSGAWRRNPEARWRLTPDRLAGLTALQSRLLARGSCRVRPGGRLVYVTCSLLPEENRARIDDFLAASAGRFRVLPTAPEWCRATGGEASFGEDDLLLTPARYGTDGFYVAVLEKAAP